MAAPEPKRTAPWLIAIASVIAVAGGIGLDDPSLFRSTGGIVFLVAATIFCGVCLYFMERPRRRR